jgi:hypothetical protein
MCCRIMGSRGITSHGKAKAMWCKWSDESIVAMMLGPMNPGNRGEDKTQLVKGLWFVENKAVWLESCFHDEGPGEDAIAILIASDAALGRRVKQVKSELLVW